MYEGEEVKIVKSSLGWLFVEFPDGSWKPLMVDKRTGQVYVDDGAEDG